MENIEPTEAQTKGAGLLRPSVWRDIILLAICYYIAGRIGISLAVPPGYATIIWPASGVALCALLARGSARWPGIWLGSFILNAVVGVDNAMPGPANWQVFAIAAALASGAALQALVGFSIALRFADDLDLTDLRRVGRAIFAVIVVPCLIAPTIGLATLLFSGASGLDMAWSNWSTWYMGDLLGVLLTLPILLFSSRSPVAVRWNGQLLREIHSLVALSLVATLLLTFYAWKFISEQEYGRAKSSFSTLASNSEEALRHRLQIYQTGMQGAAAFVASSDNVTPPEWRDYIDRLDLARAYPGMRGIGIFEQTEDADIPALAEKLRLQYGEQFRIHPQVQREPHYIITRIEPLSANYAALGLDLAFEEGRSEAILRSRTQANAVLTRPVVLIQDDKQGAGFLLVLPIRDDRGTPTDEWIYAPLVAEELFASLTPAQEKDFAIEVYFGSLKGIGEPLYRSASAVENPKFEIERTITLAGQPLIIRWTSLHPFVGRNSSSGAAIAVGGGLAITLLLGLLLITFLRRENFVFNEVERATVELAEQNRMLELAEATAHIGHWRLDIIENSIRWSDEVFRLHGIEIGQPPELEHAIDLYHPDDRARVEQSLTTAIETRDPYELRARLLVESGEVRNVEVRGQVQTDQEGEVIAVFGVIIDRTQETIMRERLTESIEEARAADRAKTSFLANMSHEIRTPMNGVIGFTELALSAEKNPDQKRRLQMIADSGNAMLRLLNDLLDFAKIEAKQMAIVKESTSLSHALRSCQRLMEPVARGQGLDLVLKVDPAIPERIMIDKMRLRQIVLNLLGNALKFTGEGEVTLSAAVDPQDPQTLTIAVKDTGIGIPDDRQESIFGKFTQADETTAREYGGTGLGLPISAELAELMGGKLTVRSTPRAGSTFTLSLPLEKGAAVVGSPLASDPWEEARRGRKLTILVAEDNPVNQELTMAMVERSGHECELARDGREAVDMVIQGEKEDRPFDMVLMDMQMPRMDGIEATRTIRTAGIDAEKLPILAITANAYADDIKRCEQAGMQAHLAKPLRLKYLRAAISEWSPLTDKTLESAPPESPSKEALEQQVDPRLQAMFEERLTIAHTAIDRVLRNGSATDKERNDIADILHQIAGVAAYFGQEALGALCRAKSHELNDSSNTDQTLALLTIVQEQLAISFG